MKAYTLLTLSLLIVASAYTCCCYGAENPPPTVQENNADVVRTYLGVKVYKMERACARQGGMCVQKADCQAPTTKSGLCPENAHQGVECCYEVVPPQGLGCRQYNGRCDEWCHPGYRMPASDCRAGTVCCASDKK